MSEYIPATPANMRQYPGLCALDLETRETWSATAGDYFWLADNEPLTNEAGEPLVLAVALGEQYEPFQPPCFDEGRCVGHERYPGAGTYNLRYCDQPDQS